MMWRRLIVPALAAYLWLPTQVEPATADMPAHAICRSYVTWALAAGENRVLMDQMCGLQPAWWEHYQ
jgi:hypothetical protein